jgi:hypothetical protein
MLGLIIRFIAMRRTGLVRLIAYADKWPLTLLHR